MEGLDHDVVAALEALYRAAVTYGDDTAWVKRTADQKFARRSVAADALVDLIEYEMDRRERAESNELTDPARFYRDRTFALGTPDFWSDDDWADHRAKMAIFIKMTGHRLVITEEVIAKRLTTEQVRFYIVNRTLPEPDLAAAA